MMMTTMMVTFYNHPQKILLLSLLLCGRQNSKIVPRIPPLVHKPCVTHPLECGQDL